MWPFPHLLPVLPLPPAQVTNDNNPEYITSFCDFFLCSNNITGAQHFLILYSLHNYVRQEKEKIQLVRKQI